MFFSFEGSLPQFCKAKDLVNPNNVDHPPTKLRQKVIEVG